jgi:hypothetical protein
LVTFQINRRASFKTFQFEVCAYLFKVKSKIPDFEPVEAKCRSRSSGTQRLSKLGRLEIGSEEIIAQNTSTTSH